MITKEKQRAQVKSKFYYIFWGIATFSVVAGQVYVGTSYRAMSRSMNRWFEETIDIMQEPVKRRTAQPDGYYMPVPVPENYGMTIIQ